MGKWICCSLLGWLWIQGLVLADEDLFSPRVSVRSLSFSPDGKRLAASGSIGRSDGVLRVWDTANWKQQLHHQEPAGFPQLAFSPNSQRLALARFAAEAWVFDLATGDRVERLTGHEKDVRCICFTSDGTEIITGGYDGTVRRWNAKTGKPIATIAKHQNAIFDVEVSRDGRIVAAAERNTYKLHIIERSTGKALFTSPRYGSLIYDVAFAPKDKRIGVACWDGTYTVLDATTFQPVRTIRGTGGTNGGSFSSDGQWLAVVSNSSYAYVFRAIRQTDQELRTKVSKLLEKLDDDSYAIRASAMEQLRDIGPPATQQLLKAEKSPSAEVRWRVRTLQQNLSRPKSAIKLQEHQDTVESVAFSPDGKLLATGDSGGTIFIWETTHWKRVGKLNLEFNRR